MNFGEYFKSLRLLTAGKRLCPPAPKGHDGPYRLDDSEGPRALQKPVDGAERAGAGETEDKPVAAILEMITNEHRRHGKEAKDCQTIHNWTLMDEL